MQTNIVRENGRRGTYLSILKNGRASTLAIVDQIKSMLPQIKSTLPDDVRLELLADQSVYVRATIDVGPGPRGVALGGGKLWVTRFAS